MNNVCDMGSFASSYPTLLSSLSLNTQNLIIRHATQIHYKLSQSHIREQNQCFNLVYH